MPNPIDRSLAFTALLEFGWFARMRSEEGTQVITRFLDSYYAACELSETVPANIWEYAKTWKEGPDGKA
jgi:hypothetical protein